MIRIKLLVAGLVFAGMVSIPSLASADVNDFVITNFESNQTLTTKDPQGQLRIIEKINVDFHDFNHGILRAIPQSYKNHSLQLHVNSIHSETGAATQYTTYSQNGNTVLKIGSASRTITGPQEYTIDYTVSNVLSFYGDKAELYWDVNGNDWQQPFNAVEAKVTIPNDLQLSETPSCYTGALNSNARNCTVTQNGQSTTFRTTQPLTANENLTYVISMKNNGAFHVSTWYETLGEFGDVIIGISLPIIAIGGSSLVYWWRRGRDAKGTGVIVPQYDAPDTMNALQIDGLMDFSVGNSGITATIIDLAVRGYIQIVETKVDKKLRKDTTAYSLKLVNGDTSALDENEKTLLSALFSSMTAGETVDVSKQKNKLYSTSNKLRNNVKQQLKEQGYFRTKVVDGKKHHTGLVILAVAIVSVLALLYGGLWSIIGFVVGGLIAVVCFVSLDARTAKGTTAKEHVEGLKLYLNVAEKDRITKLQSPNAKYAEKSAEPKKTVELFEKLLPFAIVLGVENQWAKQFETLYTNPPDWYSGNWSTFNAYYLTTHLNDGIGSAVNSAFTAPSSSGSSGSGGGGFSGGGGGGGGGGGW